MMPLDPWIQLWLSGTFRVGRKGRREKTSCPEAKKLAFLEELMSFMTKKMQAATNKSATTESGIPLIVTWDITAEEKVATWNFNALDKNNNKHRFLLPVLILEKKEWKNFRALISSNRQLRRCGKRLPRYCDTNHDRKISLSEWLNCLNAQRTNPTINVDPTPGSRRRGLNPLQIYLKD
ncbi:unnamed protein product [Timema podura]|uniref:SPARC/Testican calcium-binding domain-containing protein n=1 Tax=Timema podura TaxID=61482 RepID=A0ABN7P3C0_TIMPD|nr:unnamed protein product [Timema podura]